MSNAVSFLKYGDVAEFRNGLNFSKDSHGKGCKFIGVADFKDNFLLNGNYWVKLIHLELPKGRLP